MAKQLYHAENLDFLQDPSENRLSKPRKAGLTMVMDKGMGIHAFTDLVQAAGKHIDYIKLGFGTAVLYPAHILQQKLSIAKQNDIQLFPGGTFFEVAYLKNQWPKYLEHLCHMGFEAVEVSDGTIDLSRKERDRVIHEARKLNLQVLSECGKKAAGSSLEIALIKETLLGDIEMGASHMIIEGRESGVNVGFFDNSGKIAEDSMLLIKEAFKETETIIWEAPKKDQQSLFITLFGSNVNLGNIHHDEVIALEALRRGLRSDTLNLYS